MKVDFVAVPSKITSDETTLKCPECGDEHLHIVSVDVHRGNDKTTISNEAITVKEEKNETRGVTITLEYVCENGHHGKIIFQFHKGMSYVTHESLDPNTDRQIIWRT